MLYYVGKEGDFMQKLILIKYAELNTKKANIGMFLKQLKTNLLKRLEGYPVSITFDKGRMFLKVLEEDSYFSVLEIVRNTFGIHEVVVGYEISDTSLDSISSSLIEMISSMDFKTFKIETKRSDKSYPMTSLEISKYLGGIVLKNKKDVSVDVHHPEVTIYVEVRQKYAYIYSLVFKGIGGYPVGTLGKGLLMLSGGIDSPVAGYFAMKRGVKLEAIYFESPPHTSVEAKNKVLSLAHILSTYGDSIKVHVIPFTEIQEAIYKNIPHDYLITIMRRMMYRISARIAYRNRAKILVNGESIGQVASQTLSSMSVINEVVRMPVIRPVACFDKLEIIDVAKKIGTYDTSILPYEDCCTIFVPEHPVIHPELEKCLEYEKRIPYEELIEKALKQEEVIRGMKKNEFEDLL